MKMDGKENNKIVGRVTNQVLAPLFDPLAEKKPGEGVRRSNLPHRPLLPTDYNTAKLMYKATKARTATRDGIYNERVASAPTNDSMIKNSVSSDHAKTPPTVESGLKELGLVRPLDNKTFEFGLAKGIQLHLTENIKLCGLKKAREKSLLDMVLALCNHLTNRELDIERWVEFADKIALASAEKLNQTMLEHQAICCSKADEMTAAHQAMLNVRKEVQKVTKEMCKTRTDVLEKLTSFPSVICDVENLRHHVKNHCSNMRSECKLELRRAIDELTTSHNNEKRRLESVIDRLEISIRVEGEKVKSLQCQLIDTAALLKDEQLEHSSALTKMMKDEHNMRNDLQRAKEQIKSLEVLVENERIQKAKELRDKDEKMKAELDTIDEKVKLSIKSLIESKNKAIEEARKFKAQLENRSNNNQK